MAQCGPTAVKTGGGGIACLLRQFETRIDAGGVFDRPPQKSVRPGSILGQRNDLKTVDQARSNPTEPTPKQGKLTRMTSFKGQNTNVQRSAAPLSSPSGLSSDRSLSNGTVTVEKRSQTPSEELKTEENNYLQRVTTTDDNAVGENSKDEKLSTSNSSAKDSVTALEGTKPPVTGAGEREDDSRSSETIPVVPISDNHGSSTGPMSVKDSKAAETTALKGKEPPENAPKARFIFKQASKENPNTTVYWDDASSPSTSNKVRLLARSMENLCSSSSSSNSAATPTKEHNAFPTDKYTKNEKWNKDPPATAPAVIPSNANPSLMGNEQTLTRTKKQPPPPVPKKNPKVSRDAGSQDTSSETDQSHVMPRSGESQTLPNLNQTKKPTRPTTLFPGNSVDGDRAAAAADDDDADDRCKSLPILGGSNVTRNGAQLLPIGAQLLPIGAEKNTLFPANRQKSRGRIVSRETGNDDDGLNSDHDFSPGPPYGHSADLLDDQTTPMSLGARNTPSVDSLTDVSDKYPSVSNLNPTDQSSTNSTTKSTEKTDIPDWSEAFNFESFLSDAFDFLGSSNSAENESKPSPLKSWTDAWLGSTYKTSPEISDSSRKNCLKKSDAKDENAKEKTGNTSDKMKTQDDRAITSKLQYVDMNKATKVDNRSDEETGAKPAAHFGVVLRRNGAPSSLLRRSSFASTLASMESTVGGPSNARPESHVGRPSTVRRTTESFRASDRASFDLSRKPSAVSTCSSTVPLTILPSQKAVPKIFGKSAGGRTSSFIGSRRSVADGSATGTTPGRGTKEVKTINEHESEFNIVDRAFNFLDNSGA